MTTVTFVFLTLSAWMVSTGTWLSLDQRTELTQHGQDDETKGRSSSASYSNAVIHDATQLTLTCERSPEMGAAVEMIFTQDWITKVNTCFPGLLVDFMFFNGCVNPLNREQPNRHVCKRQVQQLLVYFRSKTSYILLTMELKIHNPDLNYRRICASSVVRRSAAHIITHVIEDRWKTTQCICICKSCNLKIKNLKGVVDRGFGPAFVFMQSKNQASLMSSEELNATDVRICCVQMLSRFYTTVCQKDALHSGRAASVQPDSSRWAGRIFLTAVLLLGNYMRRMKISSNSISSVRDNNSTMVLLLSLTSHSFSPSASVHQPSEWNRATVRISVTIYLCCLGTTVPVLLLGRAAHAAMTLLCLSQQQFMALPFNVSFLCGCSSFNKNVKHWIEDILVEGNVGSTQRSWSLFRQMELLATSYCMFFLLLNLLQFILAKLNLLRFLLNVQLVISLQNSRIPTKYILDIKIRRLI